MKPDFTKPKPGWRQIAVGDQVLYVPTGISWNPAGLWRVTVNGKQEYERTLDDAWGNFCSRRSNPTSRYQPVCLKGQPPKRLKTGVVGLHILVDIKPQGVYVSFRVLQVVAERRREVHIGQRPLGDVTQQWLDEMACLGAATRWHYLRLREQYGVVDTVKPSSVPHKTIPDKPMQRIDLDELYLVVDARLKEKREKS